MTLNEAQEGVRLPRPKLWRSWSALAALCAMLVATTLAAYSGERSRALSWRTDPALCETARAWRAQYGRGPELQIIVSEVVFRDNPGSFVPAEAVVVAPVAVELFGAQEVLDVRGIPAPARVLRVDGIHALAWPYAGTLHRELSFVALSLVRRAPGRPAVLPDSPSFETLPVELRVDARVTAADLDVHDLARCKAFLPWVKATAGDPPYTEQILRVARRLEQGISAGDSPKGRQEDVCAALREKKLSHHQAQVAAVMAARQLGAPAYALLSADVRYLVATFVDGLGFIALEIGKVDRGFQTGGTALVTKAPVIGNFEASNDGFWIPAAEAYQDRMGWLSSISSTRWSSREGQGRDDTTVTYAVSVDEVCP